VGFSQYQAEAFSLLSASDDRAKNTADDKKSP